MVVLLLALCAFALLRWQAPLIAVSALGFPLLLGLYLRESRIGDHLWGRYLMLTAGLGVGLGVGWVLLTGAIFTHPYEMALGEGMSKAHTLVEELTVPVGGMIVMLVPALVVRLLRSDTRESLSGPVIGAVGATGFAAAATLTRLAPQFATGAIAHDRPVRGLLAEAVVEGLTFPLTAAAVGALVGAAMWFTTRPVHGAHNRWKATIRVSQSLLVALVLYVALGLIEVASLAIGLHVGLHILIAALALLALRIGQNAGRPGAAPQPVASTGGYGRILLPLGTGLTLMVAAAFSIAAIATPVVPRYVCPPDCGRPPLGQPVHTNPWFRSGNYKFLVQYPRPGTAYQVTFDPDGVKAKLLAGDTGTMELFGLPAHSRTAKQIADELIRARYPNATTSYVIPNALVGYEPGYGVVADEYPQVASGEYARLRLLVMVAVKNDYALAAAAVGPYHPFSPTFGNGHPSAASLELALDISKYVNSFIWREPPARH